MKTTLKNRKTYFVSCVPKQINGKLNANPYPNYATFMIEFCPFISPE